MPRILYVDDEQSISRAVEAWLSRRGVDADCVRSLAGARQCLALHEYDGAFVDVWLGDGSGLDLLEEIRERRPALASRLAFITGDAMPRDDVKRRLAELGRPVIQKPFDLATLDVWIATWTSPAAREADATGPASPHDGARPRRRPPPGGSDPSPPPP